MCVTVCNCVCVCAVFVFKAIHWKSLKDTHMCRHSDPVADSVWLLLKRPIPLQKEEMRGKRAARSCQTPPPPSPSTLSHYIWIKMWETLCGKKKGYRYMWGCIWKPEQYKVCAERGKKVVMIQRWRAASGPGDTWCLQSNVERKGKQNESGEGSWKYSIHRMIKNCPCDDWKSPDIFKIPFNCCSREGKSESLTKHTYRDVVTTYSGTSAFVTNTVAELGLAGLTG